MSAAENTAQVLIDDDFEILDSIRLALESRCGSRADGDARELLDELCALQTLITTGAFDIQNEILNSLHKLKETYQRFCLTHVPDMIDETTDLFAEHAPPPKAAEIENLGRFLADFDRRVLRVR